MDVTVEPDVAPTYSASGRYIGEPLDDLDVSADAHSTVRLELCIHSRASSSSILWGVKLSSSTAEPESAATILNLQEPPEQSRIVTASLKRSEEERIVQSRSANYFEKAGGV